MNSGNEFQTYTAMAKRTFFFVRRQPCDLVASYVIRSDGLGQ